MFRLVGVKSNLSAGMASAAFTTFFSYCETWRSTTAEMVAGGAGGACAWGAGVGGFGAGADPAAWPIAAEMAKLKIAGINSILTCFMKSSPGKELVTEKTITEQAEAAHLGAEQPACQK